MTEVMPDPTADTAPDTSSRAAEAVPRTLGAVLADATTDYPAVTLLDAGTDVVVQSVRDTSADVLLPGGDVRLEHLDRPAAAITDPARQAELLRQAVAALAEQVRAARCAYDTDRREHYQTLRRIRDYAVARHRDGDICRDGLDKFLDHFDLDVYEPRVRVRFTITGSYLVRTSSQGDAERDGRGYLGIDMSRVDDVVDDSQEFEVDIDGSDELDDE